MTRVLLFGGNGFIGRHVRGSLEQQPAVVSLLSPGRDEFDLLESTVDDLVALLRVVRPDAVVDCTGRLTGSGHDLMRANCLVTAKLVEAIGAVAPGTRFVRLGSAAEYGIVDYEHAVTEDDAARPVSGYGVSHLAGTELVRLASGAGEVDGAVLRVFNPIGPGTPPDNVLGRAVTLIRQAQRDRRKFIELGPLGAWRDFVDVRDVAAAVSAAVFAPLDGQRVFNIGRGQAVQCRQVVNLLVTTAGFAGVVREGDPAPARSAAVDWMLADVSRARTGLEWVPVHELADSVKAAWAGNDIPPMERNRTES
jgi:NDP-hexose 4-ketoreductase